MAEVNMQLFGQIAVQQHFINKEQLQQGLEVQNSKKNWLLGEILCFLHFLEEPQIQKILHIQNSSKSNHKYLGRYKILKEVGCGGMGRVFKAYDSKLERNVALKVLRYGDGASEKEIERFIREAKATAKLRHPNIVALYDIDSENNQNFFTMDFIPGLSLKNYLEQNILTIRQTIIILIKVAQAVGYAHSHGIIHRDIKPSNIMLTQNNEPKVMDFGLAKVSNLQDSISKTGDVLGTPAYMSPEQAQSGDIDKRSDIYSLGATLYELLTGKPPFSGVSYLDTLYQVVHQEPLSLKHSRNDISTTLNAICLKCLEKNPKQRYQQTQDLAKDLSNFLQGKPVSAKASKWKYLKKYYKKKQLIILILILLGIIAALLTIIHQQQKQINFYQSILSK